MGSSCLNMTGLAVLLSDALSEALSFFFGNSVFINCASMLNFGGFKGGFGFLDCITSHVCI